MLSYFDKENFNVIYREYKFVYDNWFINLNMNVIVHLDYVGGIHVPTKILYDGFWKVLFFKKERADFNLKLFEMIKTFIYLPTATLRKFLIFANR